MVSVTQEVEKMKGPVYLYTRLTLHRYSLGKTETGLPRTWRCDVWSQAVLLVLLPRDRERCVLFSAAVSETTICYAAIDS